MLRYSILTQCIAFGLLGIFIYYISSRFLEGRFARFWSVLLWVPYLAFFVFLFESVLPLTNLLDDPVPLQGFVVLAQLVVFPFYISFFYILGNAFSNKEWKTY